MLDKNNPTEAFTFKRTIPSNLHELYHQVLEDLRETQLKDPQNEEESEIRSIRAAEVVILDKVFGAQNENKSVWENPEISSRDDKSIQELYRKVDILDIIKGIKGYQHNKITESGAATFEKAQESLLKRMGEKINDDSTP